MLDKRDAFQFRSPHGMLSFASHTQVWHGVTVHHMQHFNRPGRAWHDLSADQNTLTIVLEEIGGQCEAREKMWRPTPLERMRPNHISFIPAEMRTWAYSEGVESVRETRLLFESKDLRCLLGENLTPGAEQQPRLMQQEGRVWHCASLLGQECLQPGPTRLYGESVVAALLSAFFEPEASRSAGRGPNGLPKRKLNAVIDYLHAHLEEDVSLQQIALLTGLSVSQFSRGFKTSTGLSPHRFLLQLRVQRAQHLLRHGQESLSSIAGQIGFADQSHFTRVFRRIAGSTPKEWRRRA